MTAAAVVVWQAPEGLGGPPWRKRLRILGILALVALAFLYRAESGSGLFQMRPRWWGILGLIGWSYLVAASAYLVAGDRPAVHVGLASLLYCLYLADEAGQAGWLVALRPVLELGRGVASHSALTLSGLLLGLMVQRHRRGGAPGTRLVGGTLLYAASLAVAGLMLHSLRALHPAFWISKNLATPSWCLLSGAATAAVWAALFLVVDLGGARRWPKSVLVAGENALVVYLLVPLVLSLFALSAPLFGGTNPYHALDRGITAVGLLRSAVFAWFAVRLTGALRSAGVRMQI
jgi:predicted acyltransferase